jgi:hypothetical protein
MICKVHPVRSLSEVISTKRRAQLKKVRDKS